MNALATLLFTLFFAWLLFGCAFLFLDRASRQGLTLSMGGEHPVLHERILRRQESLGRVGKVMFRELWAVPVLALAGFLILVTIYKV